MTEHIDRCSGAVNHFNGKPPFTLEVESYESKHLILDQISKIL